MEDNLKKPYKENFSLLFPNKIKNESTNESPCTKTHDHTQGPYKPKSKYKKELELVFPSQEWSATPCSNPLRRKLNGQLIF